MTKELRNQIRRIIDESLDGADFNGLGLKELPEELCIDLRIARILANTLHAVDASSLKRLNLAGNKLGTISERLRYLNHLEDVTLFGNGLKFLPPVETLSKLRILNLRQGRSLIHYQM